MAIEAHFEKSGNQLGKPRLPRHKLRLEAQGSTEAGGATRVLVHNISTTGLLLETRMAMAIGDRIDLDLPQSGMTSAKVIWISGNLFGCQFDSRISSATLSAAQLQSPGERQVAESADHEHLSNEAFCVRLRRLRKERGLTLAQVAVQLGVSKPTVWAWEQGKARPVDGRLKALAHALGVSEADLMPDGDIPGLRNMLARYREQVARAVGISPEKVRIMIEL